LLLLWLHQTNDYDGICCFSGYIKPMTMTLLLWLHQTNDCKQRRNKYRHSHWFGETREATNTVSHWFDVTREATNTVIVIGLMQPEKQQIPS
jgi:aspartyl/asparaginyl beta-hydroxylase (cupin superfamily)